MSAPLSYAAIGLAFLAAAAGSSGDYQLVVPGLPTMCTKGLEVCETARTAISSGFWLLDGISRDTPTRCEPHPECFTDRENCVARYNCE